MMTFNRISSLITFALLAVTFGFFGWFLGSWITVLSQPAPEAEGPAIFGWIIPTGALPWLAWGIAIALTLALAVLLTAPLEYIKRLLVSVCRTQVGTFLSMLLFSALASVVLFEFDTSMHLLILMSVVILARLEMQENNLPLFLDVCILFVVSLIGLTAGWGLYWLTLGRGLWPVLWHL